MPAKLTAERVDDEFYRKRYEGYPLLRALDWYVLSVIGQLDEDASVMMDQLIRRSFRVTVATTWESALEQELHLGPNIRNSLRTMWEGYVDFEAKKDRAAVPVQFAMSVVDENFRSLITRPAGRGETRP